MRTAVISVRTVAVLHRMPGECTLIVSRRAICLSRNQLMTPVNRLIVSLLAGFLTVAMVHAQDQQDPPAGGGRGRGGQGATGVGSARSIRDSMRWSGAIPDPAGAAPFHFPYLPMSAHLPLQRSHYPGLRASVETGDWQTSRQIVALRDQCVSEHRFCPKPVFSIRSSQAAVGLPQSIRNCGDFAFSRAGGFRGSQRYTHVAPFRCLSLLRRLTWFPAALGSQSRC